MPEGYVKHFDHWSEHKKRINEILGHIGFKERDIWWCSIGCNIGSELDGKNDEFERPVIIFRKLSDDTAWIIPIISRKIADGSRYEYDLTLYGERRIADVSQLRIISTKRLLRYMDVILYEDFQGIRKIYADLA